MFKQLIILSFLFTSIQANAEEFFWVKNNSSVRVVGYLKAFFDDAAIKSAHMEENTGPTYGYGKRFFSSYPNHLSKTGHTLYPGDCLRVHSSYRNAFLIKQEDERLCGPTYTYRDGKQATYVKSRCFDEGSDIIVHDDGMLTTGHVGSCAESTHLGWRRSVVSKPIKKRGRIFMFNHLQRTATFTSKFTEKTLHPHVCYLVDLRHIPSLLIDRLSTKSDLIKEFPNGDIFIGDTSYGLLGYHVSNTTGLLTDYHCTPSHVEYID